MKCFDGVAASDVVARSFQVMQFASKDSVYWSALDVRVSHHEVFVALVVA